METQSSIAWEIPWTEEWVSYSPWDHKESDTAEWLNTHMRKCLFEENARKF